MIIDSGATDHFFANRAYFATYEKYHYEFQTCFEKILTVYLCGDVVLYLAYSDCSEVTWTIKRVSWPPSSGKNLLSTIFLVRKGVEVFLRQLHIPSKIRHHGYFIGVVDIIDNQYVVRKTDHF